MDNRTERERRLDDLLDLFTCPHCGEIKMRERNYNGQEVCFDCYSRACQGYQTRKLAKWLER